jgi:hypothetical protein
MTKITTLKLIIAVLLLLNIVLIGSKMLKPNGPPPLPKGERGKPMEVMDHFGFDEEQMTLFDVSREKHKRAMVTLRPQLEQASLAYYTTTYSGVDSDAIFAIADSLNDEIYKANKEHFDELRAICRPDQLKHVDSFIQVLIVAGQRPPRGTDRPARRQ